MDTMDLLKKSYMDAGISPEVYDYCHGISSRMKDRFAADRSSGGTKSDQGASSNAEKQSECCLL